MIAKGNVTIGLETRFGPDWPGVQCGARTKSGGECQRPAVKRTGAKTGSYSQGPRATELEAGVTSPNLNDGIQKIKKGYPLFMVRGPWFIGL